MNLSVFPTPNKNVLIMLFVQLFTSSVKIIIEIVSANS